MEVHLTNIQQPNLFQFKDFLEDLIAQNQNKTLHQNQNSDGDVELDNHRKIILSISQFSLGIISELQGEKQEKTQLLKSNGELLRLIEQLEAQSLILNDQITNYQERVIKLENQLQELAAEGNKKNEQNMAIIQKLYHENLELKSALRNLQLEVQQKKIENQCIGKLSEKMVQYEIQIFKNQIRMEQEPKVNESLVSSKSIDPPSHKSKEYSLKQQQILKNWNNQSFQEDFMPQSLFKDVGSFDCGQCRDQEVWNISINSECENASQLHEDYKQKSRALVSMIQDDSQKINEKNFTGSKLSRIKSISRTLTLSSKESIKPSGDIQNKTSFKKNKEPQKVKQYPKFTNKILHKKAQVIEQSLMTKKSMKQLGLSKIKSSENLINRQLQI